MTQDEKLDLMLQKLLCIETKVDSLEMKVDSLETKVDSLETKVDSLEIRIDSLEKKVDSNYIELKEMDEAILNEVVRVHHILLRHINDKKMHMA